MVSPIEYVFLGMASAATIGPVSIETVRRGLKGGFSSAFSVNIGATIIDAVYLLLIFFGLASFVTNPTFKIALGIFGAVVLVFFGVQSIREFFMKQSLFNKMSARESKGSFVAGMLINISNPMAIMAWLAFYGVVSSSVSGIDRDVLLFNLALVVVGTTLWGLILSYMTHLWKKVMTEKALRYVSLISGMILIGFGLYFGYTAILVASAPIIS